MFSGTKDQNEFKTSAMKVHVTHIQYRLDFKCFL